MRAEPAFKLLGRNFSGGNRSEGFADDFGFTAAAAAILVVDYELQRVVDQLGEANDITVAQLRQFSAGRRIGLAALVELDRVGLATDLLGVPFPSA
jgi:hypothetical protein